MNDTLVHTDNDFYRIAGEEEDPNITCFVKECEMLKISKDGFWVRGVKVPQDEKEAETVYKAFRQFLAWSELNRQ